MESGQKKDSKSKVAADFFVEYKKESAVPIELKIYGGGRVAFYQIKQARAKSGAILQDAVEPVKANIARVSAKGKPCDESCPLQLSNAERRLGNHDCPSSLSAPQGTLEPPIGAALSFFIPYFLGIDIFL